MRTTSKDVKRLLETIESHGYKTHWTCCCPEGSNRWWVAIDNPNTNGNVDIHGNTREVYQWLKGILSGLYIAK